MSKTFRPDGDGLENGRKGDRPTAFLTQPGLAGDRQAGLVWRSAAASHTGCVRRYNEDAYFANPRQGFWCVADGMGGHAAGDLAARMLVEAVAMLEAGPSLTASVELLRTAILKVNVALCGDFILAQTGGTCGSTVVALAIAGDECACLWAGDSRLYLYRAGNLYQMSRDHSLVQELLDQRLIESHEAGQHPRRHVITRAVGADTELELDQIQFALLPDDQLLLCSDGLYGELDADTILGVLAQPFGCEHKVNQLIERALDLGARDNVTVNLIEVYAA